MVGGRWLGQRDASRKQCGDGIGISDSARGWLWFFCYFGDGAVRTDGVRGDRVGVGDIGEMQGGPWGLGNASCGDYGRGAAWQYDRSILCGPWFCEWYVVSRKPGGDRVGFGDVARVEPWACGFHGDGAVRADGMQGYIVGVGDISAMPCGAWGSGDAGCGDEGRGEARQHDEGILCRSWLYERYA